MSRRPWTEAENAYLRERYVADGAAACGVELGRPWRSVASRASKMKLTRVRPWMNGEDGRLAVMWGVHPIAHIAKALGRSEMSIYWRAGELGVGLGCPQGHEYLTAAAHRTGYALATLRRILNWARVRIERAWINPTKGPSTGRRLRHVVEASDVDEAVAAWCALETVEHAAERLGICGVALTRLLVEAQKSGDDRVSPKPKRRRHWRLPSDVIDVIVAEHRRRETIGEASRRVGHDRRTLIQWLTVDGIAYVPFARLDPNDIDRVVARRLADPKCKARRAA